jgi:hypothetical protein
MNYLYKFKNKCENKIWKIKKNQPRAAVIIEPRSDELLELVLMNFMYFLEDDWSLYIFHGTKNENYVKNITKNMGDIYYVNLNVDNLTVYSYNRLLTSNNFYNQIHCDNILIFQIDTLLRKPIPMDLLKYDYVGAPWTPGIPGIGGMVGNGGLSLRRASTMKKIISEHKYDGVNEDAYFSRHCKDKYYPADFETASSFSIETYWHPDPIGIHQPHVQNFPKDEYLKLLL